MTCKICECVDGKLIIEFGTNWGRVTDNPCPCDCHKEKPMKDKELDFEKVKQSVKEIAELECHLNDSNVAWLIKEVERLRISFDAVAYEELKTVIEASQKENATLKEEVKRLLENMKEKNQIISQRDLRIKVMDEENFKLHEDVEYYQDKGERAKLTRRLQKISDVLAGKEDD